MASYKINNGYLKKYNGKAKNPRLPKSTHVICGYAFEWAEGVTNVKIDGEITAIEQLAFMVCPTLERVDIGAKVAKIEISAFFDCDNLAIISVDENNPNYKSLNGDLYTKDGKTLIHYAKGKKNKSVEIQKGVEKIGVEAFFCDVIITNVAFNDDLRVIESDAFSCCSSLRRVELPDSLIELGACAFGACNLLKEVVIPKSVSIVGGDVFGLCKNLETIYCEAEEKPEGWDENWIGTDCSAKVAWGYVKENSTKEGEEK